MLKKLLLLSIVTVSATHAFAMPDVVGEYNCAFTVTSANGTQSASAPATFSVVNNELFISGLETSPSQEGGLVCKNGTEDASQNGATAKMISTCNDSEVSADATVSVPAQGMEAKVKISVKKTATDTVTVQIVAGGMVNGQDITANVQGTCVKK